MQTHAPLPSIPEEMTSYGVAVPTGRPSLLLVRGAVAGARLKKTAVLAVSAMVIVVAASGLLSTIIGTPAADDSSIRRTLKVKAASATKGPAGPVIAGYDARRTAAGMDRPRGRPVTIVNANTNSNTHRQQQRRQAQRRQQQQQEAQILASRVADAQQRELRVTRLVGGGATFLSLLGRSRRWRRARATSSCSCWDPPSWPWPVRCTTAGS